MPYEVATLGLQAAFSGVAAPQEYVSNRQRGQTIGRAAAVTAADFGLNTLANPATLGLVMMARILISAGAPAILRSNENIRQVNTPFSHGYHATRLAGRLQAEAMQQMASMRGGAGISSMYGR